MELSKQEIRELCDAADMAWKKARPRTRVVRFKHGGKAYMSTLTSFRMLVQNAGGEPVACRYF